MATSSSWLWIGRLTFFSVLCIRSMASEVCYEKINTSNVQRRLTCPTSCCGDYKKYCCGPLNPPDQTNNDTRLSDTTLSEKAVGTIVGGVIVFIAMIGGVIACCFCKPSCVPEQKVGSHLPRHNAIRHRSVVMGNPVFNRGALHPGYAVSTVMTPVSYPNHSLHGQQWPV